MFLIGDPRAPPRHALPPDASRSEWQSLCLFFDHALPPAAMLFFELLALDFSMLLVARLPRQAGQKEGRFAHLLSGEIELESLPEVHVSSSRRASLEEKVDALAAEVERLKEQFEQFRKQFE